MKLQKKNINFSFSDTKISENKHYFNLDVYIFKENDIIIAYCPSLDLSACAEAYNDIMSAFYEKLQIYLEYAIENDTLKDDLLQLGWKIKNNIQPPKFNTLLKNHQFNKLVNSSIDFERLIFPDLFTV